MLPCLPARGLPPVGDVAPGTAPCALVSGTAHGATHKAGAGERGAPGSPRPWPPAGSPVRRTTCGRPATFRRRRSAAPTACTWSACEAAQCSGHAGLTLSPSACHVRSPLSGGHSVTCRGHRSRQQRLDRGSGMHGAAPRVDDVQGPHAQRCSATQPLHCNGCTS